MQGSSMEQPSVIITIIRIRRPGLHLRIITTVTQIEFCFNDTLVYTERHCRRARFGLLSGQRLIDTPVENTRLLEALAATVLRLDAV